MTNPKNIEKINGKLWKNFFFLKNFQSNKKTRGTGQEKNVIIKIGQSMLEGNMEFPKKDRKKGKWWKN